MNPDARPGRIGAIDTLRGIVMALMLVDHVREFFFLHRQVADPMLLADTPADLFVTRLLAHLCAPVFVFLTGLGAWLHGQRGGASPRDTAAYLFKRGLLLIALELTLINFAWTFTLPPKVIYLQVIWAIGLSMIALAALLRLPRQALLALGLVIVFGHNLLDGLHFPAGHPAHVPWAILHDRGMIELGDALRARTSYPVLPWIGVILLSYATGPLYRGGMAPGRRQRILFLLGTTALGLFGVLRLANVYGDQPRSVGPTGLDTLMSFFNLTKYPPSLLFILLTLGIGLLGLAWLERCRAWDVAARFGQVPLFFYAIHLYLLHLLHLACTVVFGHNQGSRFGFDVVWQVWLLALTVLVLLGPLCQWFAGVKRRSPGGWVSYF